jgi:hypothetical protein
MRTLALTVVVLGSVCLVVADNGPKHRVLSNSYGTSGGNVKDIAPISTGGVCCASGTLGGLVKKSGVLYILSNDHVFGRPISKTSNSASLTDPISQPGLVDTSCRPARTVANFSFAPTLGSGVDAAIAKLKLGTMNTSGSIMDVGIPAGTTTDAAVGMLVAKSGRTSGLTCGKVAAISVSATVQYTNKPACTGVQGVTKFNVTFTNQVVVQSSSGSFSKAGDSGSFILKTNTAQGTALLFAGSTTLTLGNPMGTVLSKLGAAIVGGPQHSVTACVGKTSASPAPATAILESEIVLSQAETDRATAAKEFHAARLMKDPAVLGVGVGANDEVPWEGVVVIFVEKGRKHAPIPDNLNGVRTKVMYTDRFVGIPASNCPND